MLQKWLESQINLKETYWLPSLENLSLMCIQPLKLQLFRSSPSNICPYPPLPSPHHYPHFLSKEAHMADIAHEDRSQQTTPTVTSSLHCQIRQRLWSSLLTSSQSPQLSHPPLSCKSLPVDCKGWAFLWKESLKNGMVLCFNYIMHANIYFSELDVGSNCLL